MNERMTGWMKLLITIQYKVTRTAADKESDPPPHYRLVPCTHKSEGTGSLTYIFERSIYVVQEIITEGTTKMSIELLPLHEQSQQI